MTYLKARSKVSVVAVGSAIIFSSTSADVYGQLSSQPSPLERQQRESTIPTEAAPPLPISRPGEDPWSTWLDGDGIFGNWGDERDRLVKDGVTFFGSYEADMTDNVQGGKSSGQAYADNFDFGLRFDMQKLVGWDGAQIVVSGINRDGQNLSANHIGNFYPVQQVYGRETLLLYALYLDQSFMDDRLAWKIGRFSLSDDFATSPIYGLYMNNGIDGNPKSMLVSTAFPVYPASVWGTRLRYSPSKELTFRVGVFQADPDAYEPNTRDDFGIYPNNGATFVQQMEWDPVFLKHHEVGEEDSDVKAMANEAGTDAPSGLPGHYWFGSYYSTLRTPEFTITGPASTIAQSSATSTYGLYWHADQMVYQAQPGTEKGLTLWADFVLQPQQNAELIPFQFTGGAFYRGLIPTRDADSLIFGAIDGVFSDYRALTSEDIGVVNPGSEKVFEFSYRAQVTKFTYIQPNVQWIVDPNGANQIKNAVVFGMRVGITF